MPDLAINMHTMKMPEIFVRDIGSDMFAYKWEANHFSPEMKRYDHYQANIRFDIGGQIAPNSVMMDLGKVKFDQGSQIPKSYTRLYQDTQGNSFKIDRFNQKGDLNSSYNSFVQFYQRQDQMSKMSVSDVPSGTRPKPPTMELLQGFDEKWTVAARDSVQGQVSKNYEIRIDSVKNESNLKRFITEYSGVIKTQGNAVEFTVKSPHENDGRILSLDITLKGKGSPSATITWKPVDGVDGGEAFKLIRDNVPAPLLVGPRASFRFNDVDVAESPLKVTPDGSISPKQVGDVRDIANLMGKEHLGINVSFAPPGADAPKSGFSLMNGLRNLGYMLTGRWSEVKNMRQELGAMQQQEPGKFVLAAGFNNPSFMGIKELRMISGLNKNVTTENDRTIDGFAGKKKDGNGFFDIAKTIIKTPFLIAGGTLRTVFNLPVIKQAWTAVRITTGVAIGIVTGDIFNRSNKIQFDSNGPAVITINGIKNNDKAAKLIADVVQTGFQVKVGTTIKNGTHWFGIGDFIQIIAHEYLGMIDKPSLDTAKAIRTGIKEKGEVYVVAHSQGSAIFKQALTLLSKEERAAIHYLGAGPEWNIDAKAEGLASAENLWNRGDFVPHLGNRYKIITNLALPWNWGRSSNSNVQKDIDVGAKWGIAHQFAHYEDAVKKWAEKWRNQWSYGALQQAF
ncbi:MAG: hypothetical protein KCHDKBKB_01568 [Elusimicrobia bacterium]|nr:hypothetical protein [Elusimicrobiota bacterium]